MSTDPTIDVFDVSVHAGMGHYASHSASLANECRRDAATVTAPEREALLQWAATHEAVVLAYRRGDAIMAEIVEVTR